MNTVAKSCPDCGLLYALPTTETQRRAPRVCSSCLKTATPEPPDGWPVVARWVNESKGRGVFARRPLEKGETAERCWVMALSEEESAASYEMPVLNRYLFPWEDGLRVLVGGAGLLYNYDALTVTRRNPNVECVVRRGLFAVEFRALRDIEADEELTWDYHKARFRPR